MLNFRGNMDTKAKQRETLFADEIANENAKILIKGKDLIEKYTYEIMGASPKNQVILLNALHKQRPNTAMAVLLRMQDLQTGVPGMRPGPGQKMIEKQIIKEQEEEKQLKKIQTKSEKTKAQTRGNP